MFDLATTPDLPDHARHGVERLPGSQGRAEAALQRRLQRSLAEAVADGTLLLHYQPRLSLASGRWSGAEASMRWPDRRGGFIAPAVFLPAATRTGLITRMGGWMLDVACAEAVRWPGHCAVSVAVSGRQLAEGVLLDQIAAALRLSGLHPERLEITLTEAMLIDLSTDTLLLLSAVRDLGVGVTLDHFGIGFASLAVLRRLPLTAMKLDRSLLRNLPGDRQEAALLRTIVAAGHALDLIVVADGVESEDQHALLHACGCDEGQGGRFGNPATSDEVRPRMSAGSRAACGR